ncbi:hypothetical protein SAMN04487917_101343 [Arthrobacter sp. yr096]|uniref:hypothetical protein n=1 Tax=Arthrobacter sp. yr096 TaxID=1761750 RepID=UPI0008C1A202|nr:hypothetical protein [Arthrobacter sp. yr096]SEI44761.1 hypothetical protein SAMN04487917_101343 [Arthrobacter sp. yr096]
MGIVSMFPKAWRTDVIVLRSGGRDAKGNPKPTSEIPVADCMIGPRMSVDPRSLSDVPDSDIYLYRDPDPDFTFQSTDRIRVPAGKRMAGDWAINGRPAEWPIGVEVGLVST